MRVLASTGFLAPDVQGELLLSEWQCGKNVSARRYQETLAAFLDWARVDHPEFFTGSEGATKEAIRYWSKYQHRKLIEFIGASTIVALSVYDRDAPIHYAIDLAKNLRSCRGHLIKMGILPKPDHAA